ncbi:MAG: acetate/propionate family kinase [Candidatus Moraniibacteriota bacterium]
MIAKSHQCILALNVGSTSIKSRVFAFWGNKEQEVFNWSKGNINPKGGHKKVLEELKKALKSAGLLDGINAVGHRVVHGGPLKKSVPIGKEEFAIFKLYQELAPLHNPYNILGITKAAKWFGKRIPQIAVFDTAFFGNIPEWAASYPIPLEISQKYKICRYGFHGISHNYSMLEAATLLKKPVRRLNLITVHLGGGSSMAAIRSGVAIDTSMGFTPLEGLVMGTRSGDIDPGILFYLGKFAKMSLASLEDMLVNRSGVLGISGAKNMLDLLKLVRRKNKKAELAFKIYIYRIQKYIGAYTAALGKCDAIVFTGAIGAGDSYIRGQITRPLIKGILKGAKILAIMPNEEKMIARETHYLLKL